MSFESLHAATTLRTLARDTTRGRELPHLDSLVQASANKVLAVGGEGDAVYAVLVAVGALETLDQVAGMNVPDTDALIQRARGDVLRVRRDGHRGNAILYRQREQTGRGLDVPEPDSTVAASRSDGAAIASEIERIDILLVSRELGPDGPGLDIPDL